MPKLQFVPKESMIEKRLKGSIKNETNIERIKRLTGFDFGKCPECTKGRMLVSLDKKSNLSINGFLDDLPPP